MKRKDFLRGLGLAGLGLTLPVAKVMADVAGNTESPSCVLIPGETAGPFPLDLTTNTDFFRQDVREDRTGTQMNLRLKILGVNNCGPMENVRVNIWHCDKDGQYSGYDLPSNPGQAGLTYLRGYQITDANGEVEFITIFPGWYPGRTCHIHFQVYVSSSYSAISQLTWDHTTKNALLSANSSEYTDGPDPVQPQNDGVFVDGYTYQVATLTPNGTTGGYDSYMEVTVQGTGSVNTGYLEKETARHFELGQNYPNPFTTTTCIPFTVKSSAEVNLEIWDLSGKRIAVLPQGQLGVGDHEATINFAALGLAASTYVYQLEVKNSAGAYRLCKVMTAAK